MKRHIFRCFFAAALAAAFSAQALAARLLIPVGEVVGLRLSDGSVTVAAFHETLGAAAREAGISIGDEILSLDGHKVDSASELYDALKRSGGTVTVTLTSKKGEMRPAIPATAVLQDVRGPYVWVVGDGGEATRRYIARGDISREWQFVEKRLAPGERIVAEGGHKVRPGMKVEGVPSDKSK